MLKMGYKFAIFNDSKFHAAIKKAMILGGESSRKLKTITLKFYGVYVANHD